jgi:hypothetical protein
MPAKPREAEALQGLAPRGIRRIAARIRRSETPLRNATRNYEAFPQRTVRAPISREELDESSYDTVFLIAELSDAIRRGVCYFSLGGRPLDDLNSVINALVDDGEIAYDDDLAEEPVGH